MKHEKISKKKQKLGKTTKIQKKNKTEKDAKKWGEIIKNRRAMMNTNI